MRSLRRAIQCLFAKQTDSSDHPFALTVSTWHTDPPAIRAASFQPTIAVAHLPPHRATAERDANRPADCRWLATQAHALASVQRILHSS